MKRKKTKIILEKDIIAAVEFLKNENSEPTRANVAKRLNVHYCSLIEWGKRNKKSLEDLGIVKAIRERKISEARIKKAVKELKKEKIKPTIATVAKKLNVSRNSLSRWSSKKQKPLEVYGIYVMRPITEARIREAVGFLKRKKKKPTRKAVAKRLNINPHSLSTWGRANKISLERLGVILMRPVAISEARIKETIKLLKKEGEIPTRSNVAKKLGKGSNYLSKWAHRKKISLEELGIITKRITKTRVEEIVKSLKNKEETPTTEKVAREINVKEKSLLEWVKRNQFSLEGLGIIKTKRERKLPRPGKIVIRKIKKKIREKVKPKEKKMELKARSKIKKIETEAERLLKRRELTNALHKAKEWFETKEPEKLKHAIPLLEEIVIKGKNFGDGDIFQEAENYLNKIKGLIREQFEQAENLLRLGWPENAIPLFELVIDLEEPFEEKFFTFSAYKGVNKAKEKLQEKEEKRKQWELVYKQKEKIRP